MTHSSVRLIAVVFAAALSMGTSCDLLIESSQTLKLTGHEQVFGADTPNAARVRSGGTLIVEDADLFGRGEAVTVIPAGQFPTPGAAIDAVGGTVQILSGMIAAGGVVVQVDPNTFPVPAPPGSDPGAVAFAELIGVPPDRVAPLAPALRASGATVEISGGTLVPSGVIGEPNPYVPVSGTLSVLGGQLRVSGGEFRVGTMMPPSRFPRSDAFNRTLFAFNADVRISGGNFDAGPVQLAQARARISGGSFNGGLVVINLAPLGGLGLPNQPPAPTPCYEIRGGDFSSIAIFGPDPVFIVGTQFSVPLGPVMSSDSGPLMLTGVLEDGSPLEIALTAGAGTQVTLAAPGDPGCGS